MLSFLALACLIGAVLLLAALCVVDLRVRLLPNKMVLAFAVLGLIFHSATQFHYLTLTEIILGGAIGFGSLFALRAVANHICKMDTLGLGDVKLMGAAGLWLGADMIAPALMIGAVAGMAHGAGLALWEAARTKTRPQFKSLELPAGPGFAIGIILTAGYMFRNFFTVFFG